MDPQQPPRNPVETNIESEHHGSSIGSGDQGVHMSQGVQGAPQPSLPDEMARSPSQGALVESPRGLPAAMPPARPIADLPHAYYDKSGYEGIPSGGRYWEGPYDARGGRYPTSRAPGRVRTAESMRRQMPAYGDYQVQSEQRVSYFSRRLMIGRPLVTDVLEGQFASASIYGPEALETITRAGQRAKKQAPILGQLHEMESQSRFIYSNIFGCYDDRRISSSFGRPKSKFCELVAEQETMAYGALLSLGLRRRYLVRVILVRKIPAT